MHGIVVTIVYANGRRVEWGVGGRGISEGARISEETMSTNTIVMLNKII